MDIIVLKDVHKSFGPQKVLRGLNLNLHKDNVNVIIGKSGGGKSVLLKHIIGLLKPDKGQVIIDGQDIVPLSERELATVRQKFGMLFQEAALFDSLTVAENVAFPLKEHTKKKHKEIMEIVEEKLAQVGLKGMGYKMPSELSGGMRKRVGLARALALDPQIVLFDEPTSGLDPVMSAAINELIVRTKEEFGATCVVISHDIPATMATADFIFMLYEGKIIATGTPDEIKHWDDPVVQQFIHGRAKGPIRVV
ncbi:phospholipid/cholesterol/gamma-HCH transport system ATP-binding protein [Desulfonauticus submarinus]|uniref:Phospholipid/cholesterol/gamma-HCH transport system ATP-binding protein n=1 Tax=Desulfonauticus submarinus TaxID=206665 RepID=A0A1H0BWM9_9BACT|nr:ABC transporter ATP-binding protein [Desulfonauticus submarinus]SDN50099.1 phospholipid/cholesterol/gamma-HCH transport system ATP-binding protein [Desulfonauticus submarinus]